MKIMQCGAGRQPKGWFVTENHAPQYIRMYYMDGGSVRYDDDRGHLNLKKGYLYVFPSQHPYKMVQDPSDPINCLYLHADVFPYLVYFPIEIDPSRCPQLPEALSIFRSEVLRSPVKNPCIDSFGEGILSLLIRDHYISEQLDKKIIDPRRIHVTSTVAELSAAAGYTTEYFIRAFTKSAGVTPYQYLLSQRMNEAISLMNEGMKLDDIALRVGYASGKSFSGAFKRRFGIPPESYRDYFLRKA